MGKDMEKGFYYMKMLELMRAVGNAILNMAKVMKNLPMDVRMREIM